MRTERSAWAILDLADSSPQAMEALGRLAASERRRAQQRLSALLTRARDTDDVSDVARVLREMLTTAQHVTFFEPMTAICPTSEPTIA